MSEMLDTINAALIAAAEAWWLMPATLLMIVIDGLLPLIPSEALVMGLTALSPAEGRPHLLTLGIVAALGAILGDNLAFFVGRTIGLSRWRRPRMTAALDGARRAFDARPATVILTGRFVPVGRVAVYLTAGASGFPHRRFLPISILGGSVWAAYILGLGLLAGVWVEGNPLLGAAVGLGLSLILGAAADLTIRRQRARRGRVAVSPAQGGSADGGAREATPPSDGD